MTMFTINTMGVRIMLVLDKQQNESRGINAQNNMQNL